jgi:hypothetical protein
MGHGGPNGPPWTCENIRKAHIRFDDEHATMGPFSSEHFVVFFCHSVLFERSDGIRSLAR